MFLNDFQVIIILVKLLLEAIFEFLNHSSSHFLSHTMLRDENIAYILFAQVLEHSP